MTCRRFAIAAVAAILALHPALRSVAADPQPPVIIVVDFQKIVRESAAAAAVQAQIDELRNAYQEEFGVIEGELRGIESQLTELRATLTDDEFVQRRRDFELQVTEAQRRAQYRRAAMDRALDDAMDRVQETLLEVIAGIAEQQGANLVINRTQLVLADQALDFTTEALAELNQQLPFVNVVVPEQ